MKIISILLFLGTVIPILGMLIFDFQLNTIIPNTAMITLRSNIIVFIILLRLKFRFFL